MLPVALAIGGALQQALHRSVSGSVVNDDVSLVYAALRPLTLVQIGQLLLQKIDLAVGLYEDALDALFQQSVLLSRRLIENLLKGCLLLRGTSTKVRSLSFAPLSAYTRLLGLLISPEA